MKINLYFVVLIFLCVFKSYQYELDEDTLEIMQMLHDTCTKETNVDENILSEAQKGNFIDDPKLKCYVKCLFINFGAIDENENLDIEALLDLYPPDIRQIHEPTVRKCGVIAGSDSCDSFYQIQKCWYENDKEV